MFPIEADDHTGTWQGSDKHDFILDMGVEEILALRDRLNELPKTSLVTTRSHLGFPQAPDEAFWLLESWEVPDYVTGNKHEKLVNPNHPNKWQYSPVYTRCDCGAMMKFKEGNMSSQAEHTDCPRYYRQYAKGRISERRAATMRTLLRLYKSLRPRSQIFGYSRINGSMANGLCVDISEEYENGRQLLANTAKELAKDYTPKEIGEVYGVSYRSIHRAIREYTDTTPGELQEIRQA